MTLRIKLLFGSVVAASLAGTAQAATVPLFYPGLSDIEIINRENVYRLSANCTPVTCLAATANDPPGYQRPNPTVANNIIVGDRFVIGQATRSVTSLNQGTSWGEDNVPAGGVETFTAYSVQEVSSVALNVDGNADRIMLKTSTADPFGILSAADLAAGVMVRLFVDTLTQYRFDGIGLTMAQSLASFTDGALWADLGVGATTQTAGAPGLEADGYVYSEVDIGLGLGNFAGDFFAAWNIVTKYAAYSAGDLSRINDPVEVFYSGALVGDPPLTAANNAAGICVATATFGCYDITGNGQLSVNQNTSPWQFASEDPLQLYQRVPEPASLALVGLALGAAGLVGRRRRGNAD